MPTDRQMQVLQLIEDHQRARGYAPTIRQLVELLGVSSTNTVACHLAALERQRLIARDPRTARSTRLTESGRLWVVRPPAKGAA